MFLNPAQYVVHVFGGVRATARAIDRYAGTVSKWNSPKTKQGAAGKIPSGEYLHILNVARGSKLDITPDDLINGREVPGLEPPAKKKRKRTARKK